MRIVLTSVDSKTQAEAIAKALVESKLAACVQISAQGTSIYAWQGKLCTDEEYYLSIKTDESHVKQAITWLKEHHPYDTPEIIILKGKTSAEYEHWLEQTLT